MVRILGHKLCNFAPVFAKTYTPAIYRTRRELGSLCLVADIIELRVTRQTGSSTDVTSEQKIPGKNSEMLTKPEQRKRKKVGISIQMQEITARMIKQMR